jgi:hypothetical protein
VKESLTTKKEGSKEGRRRRNNNNSNREREERRGEITLFVFQKRFWSFPSTRMFVFLERNCFCFGRFQHLYK